MSTPQLTIGIPTLDRHRYLRRAIDSCLRQTVPVHVVVADQGHLPETRAVIDRYEGRVEHVLTKAKTLWENWEAAALACDTPFFAWLQDDDVVAPSMKRIDGSDIPGTGYAHRVLAAFDQFPEALHWQSRLYCGFCGDDEGLDDIVAAPWASSFPWVCMKIIKPLPFQWPGQILVPTAYLTSWAMSPAVAFRCGKEFSSALKYMPPDCGLMYERLILASMGMQGPWIADPMVAGYWIHHGGNESYKQHIDQDRQNQVMIEHLDECMDHTEWEEVFASWCKVMNPMQITGLANDFQCKSSRYADAILKVMGESLRGRVEAAQPPKSNGAQVHAPKAADRELVWN